MTTNVNLDYVLHGSFLNRCPKCETEVKRGSEGWKCPNCGHHSKNYLPPTKYTKRLERKLEKAQQWRRKAENQIIELRRKLRAKKASK